MEQYIARHVNTMSESEKEDLAKLMLIRNVELIQSNNGAYCLFNNIELETLKLINDFIKERLTVQ